jgi:hypothetical protein
LGFLFALFLLSATAPAQHIRGALEGTVTDQNGAVVRGATVTVVSDATGAKITATSDDRGSFNFQNLEAGTYKTKIEMQGFSTYVANDVVVKVGSNTESATRTWQRYTYAE